jgi:hypothetical protein
MTKCIVIGNTENKTGKPIEFIKFLDASIDEPIVEDAGVTPGSRENIELICRDDGEYDIMFAYNGKRNTGAIFLGHWNGGYVDG